jgi:hypothetical protein
MVHANDLPEKAECGVDLEKRAGKNKGISNLQELRLTVDAN